MAEAANAVGGDGDAVLEGMPPGEQQLCSMPGPGNVAGCPPQAAEGIVGSACHAKTNHPLVRGLWASGGREGWAGESALFSRHRGGSEVLQSPHLNPIWYPVKPMAVAELGPSSLPRHRQNQLGGAAAPGWSRLLKLRGGVGIRPRSLKATPRAYLLYHSQELGALSTIDRAKSQQRRAVQASRLLRTTE